MTFRGQHDSEFNFFLLMGNGIGSKQFPNVFHCVQGEL